MKRGLKTLHDIWAEHGVVEQIVAVHGTHWAKIGRTPLESKAECSMKHKRKVFWDEIKDRAASVGGDVGASVRSMWWCRVRVYVGGV